MLKTNERKKAMEYTAYMMIGSYFRKATYVQRLEEQNMRICYWLLNRKYQMDLEEACEKYFLEEVLPDLERSFLESEVRVRRFETGSKKAAIVFSSGKCCLWLLISPGRRGQLPEFGHCVVESGEDMPQKTSRIDI